MAASFLVTGATGRQGGATAYHLLKQGATVHALVRDPTSSAAQSLKAAGALVFKGDFDDIPAIKSATTGQAQNFIDAALAVGTAETVVLSTAFYTGDRSFWPRDPSNSLYPYYSGKAAIEDAVRKAGFKNYTILRPGWLFHNYVLPTSARHFPQLASEGILSHAYLPGRKMPNLDAMDVGQFAAAALLNPKKFNGHEIELGNENLTAEEAAGILSKVSGQEIKTRRYRDDEIEEMGKKVPTLGFHLMANEHDLNIDGKALEEKYGVNLTSFESFLEREEELFLKSLPSK